MRLLFALLTLTLAVVAVAASTTPIFTTQIDEISYKLVKAREAEPRTVPLFFPTVAYSKQREIQVLVIAVPYSPNDQTSLSLFKKLTSAIMKLPATPTNKWGDVWGEVADTLTKFRNVYFPYETFKVKLIFVVFVRTKTLMDLTVNSVKDLINSNVDSNKNSGALYYATAILVIMSHNKIVNNIDEKVNNMKQQMINIDVKIEENKHSYEDNSGDWQCIEWTKKNEGEEICIKYKKTRNIKVNFNITFTYYLLSGNDELQKYTFVKDDAITVTSDIEYIGDENYQIISRKCTTSIGFGNIRQDLQGRLKEILSSAKGRALNLLPEFVPSESQKDKLKILFGEIDDSDLQSFLNLLYIKLYDYFNFKFEKAIGYYLFGPFDFNINECPGDDNILQLVKNEITERINFHIKNLINGYFNFILGEFDKIDQTNKKVTESFFKAFANKMTDEAKNVISKQVTEFSNKVTDTLFPVQRAIEASTNVALECLTDSAKNLAEQTIRATVSSVPVVGQLYAVANGIAGALQREIMITGIVKSENVWGGSILYTVNTPNICIAGSTISKMSVSGAQNVCDIKDCNSGNCFKSWPSATEAIVQGIIGFISGIAKTFTGNVGEFVDMIPVVREVDVPSDNTYFMIPAKPGIYKLEIELCVSGLLEEIKRKIKEGIEQSLTKSREEVKNDELVKVINSAILESGLANKIKRFTVDVNIDNNNNIVVDIYESSGDVDISGGSDTLSVSTFIISFPPYAYGRLEGNAFRYNYSYDWFGFFRPIVADGLALVRSNLQCASPQGGSGSAGSNTKDIESSVSNLCGGVSSQVSSSISNFVQSQLSSSFIHPGEPSCSFRYIIGVGVSTFLNEVSNKVVENLRSYIKSKIEGQCQDIVTKLEKEVSESLNSLLGRAPFVGAVFTATDGDGRSASGGMSFACAIKNSLGYLAAPLFNVVEDYSYLPSYLLAGLSIRPPESIVVRRCYSVVVSPYFVHKYQTIAVTEENLPQLLLDYAEEIASSNLAINLFNTIKNHPAKVEPFPFDTIWFKSDSKYYICKPGINPVEGFEDCKKFDTLTELVKSDLFNEYISYMLRSDITFLDIAGIRLGIIFKPKAGDILNDNEFAPIRAFLSEAKSDKRSLIIPYIGGVNTYFTAFKVYPAIAVRERPEDLNAYYMVIPYSAPARELFVLGTVGDYVIYDGEPKRSDNKPFLYVDLVEGSTR